MEIGSLENCITSMHLMISSVVWAWYNGKCLVFGFVQSIHLKTSGGNRSVDSWK